MEELRTYWEVPAVAHFCSLFRVVFKLFDFDIEDFEEALIVDTESSHEGGRSSLIVDILIALLRGCYGRRDITLLNYNEFLHDWLEMRWVTDDYGPNPLGTDRQRACFHILPLFAKVKLLHHLCEWRLERPDVETLTKNLNGDSLRILPLGQDQKDATYWYFYGTRLYREDAETKLKVSSSKAKNANKSSDGEPTVKKTPGRRRKRRRRNYDIPSSKKKKTTAKKRRSRSPSQENDHKRAKLDEAVDGDNTMTDLTEPEKSLSEAAIKSDLSQTEDIVETPVQRTKLKLEPDVEENSVLGEPSVLADTSATPTTSRANNNLASLADHIMRIYSRDEEEDDSRDTKSEKTTDNSDKLDVKDGLIASVGERPSATFMKKPFVPTGPPPWDQPNLRPPKNSIRWHLICSTMEDWQTLTDSFERPKAKQEKQMYEVLHRDFLPAMKDLFDQKERERQRRLAELLPRRTSDRLEVKRLQQERDDKLLAQREQDERDRLAKVDDEKLKRMEQEKREQRLRLRELEKEKRERLKERAREERCRRLELRQLRQQLLAEGKEIPNDLLNATAASALNDEEMDELDIEIELEHMYGQFEKLLDQFKSCHDAEPFLKPVKEDEAPGYYGMIENPMDIERIGEKLADRVYKNKAEFVTDINTMLLNCLRYNGLDSEYTKIAQLLERTFIKLWKKYFPPAELEDSGERVHQEELHCISLLGALDKKIKDEIAKFDMEEKIDISERRRLALERKRENDRRRRRLKAEAKRAQTAAEAEALAMHSLSTLTDKVVASRKANPPPFLVGNSNRTRESPASDLSPKRVLPPGPGLVYTKVLNRPTTHSDATLPYYPGISATPRHAPPNIIRSQAGRIIDQNRLVPAQQQNQQQPRLAPITVQSSSAPEAKVIKFPLSNVVASSFPSYTVDRKLHSSQSPILGGHQTDGRSTSFSTSTPNHPSGASGTRLVKIFSADQHPSSDAASSSGVNAKPDVEPKSFPLDGSVSKDSGKESFLSAPGKNVLVQLKDGAAYIMKKDESTGELRTVGPINKAALAQKVAELQKQRNVGQQLVDGQAASASNAPKPICSVAPVRQTPQVALSAATNIGDNTASPSSSTLHTPKVVNIGQTMVINGQQYLLLPSQSAQVITIGTPLVLANPTSQSSNLILTSTANSSQSTPSSSGVQLIQVMPQIMVNAPIDRSGGNNDEQPSTDSNAGQDKS